ncbi:MAG: hypothetical protein CV087_17195 [Candidatus Brocadia sp. WS118]|nr:MAG: hypothetical protein CV087_17195 [Candidatus Brocadia sp. WS118]
MGKYGIFCNRSREILERTTSLAGWALLTILAYTQSEIQQSELFTPDFYVTYLNTMDVPALSAQAGMIVKKDKCTNSQSVLFNNMLEYLFCRHSNAGDSPVPLGGKGGESLPYLT